MPACSEPMLTDDFTGIEQNPDRLEEAVPGKMREDISPWIKVLPRSDDLSMNQVKILTVTR